jgi:pyruvate dehydrogenase E2 component (dihydrolipoamide acetyltransferase)
MAEFLMPHLGADMTAGTLQAWRKKPGDHVTRGDIIADVETDKADVEVEVFTTGVLEKILIEPGTKVPVGTVLAIIRQEGEVISKSAARVSPPAPAAAAPISAPLAPAVVHEEGRLRISPAARKLAQELGIDPASVSPTGPEGRITREDIEHAARAYKADSHLHISPLAKKLARELGIDPASVTPTGPGGRISREDIEHAAQARKAAAPETAPPVAADRTARMRQAIAAAMARSKREIPHYYLTTTIDFQTALTWLNEENLKRSVEDRFLYGILLVKAVALALREQREFNAVWSEGQVVLKPEINVGVAISLRQGGLIAPALLNADQKPLGELMKEFRDLVQRARSGSLRSSELSESTITVTSLGEQGVEGIFGIIYPPQVALVGFGRINQRPWSVEGQVVSRPLITASLSADHRVSDGHRGGLFLNTVERLLQEPERL